MPLTRYTLGANFKGSEIFREKFKGSEKVFGNTPSKFGMASALKKAGVNLLRTLAQQLRNHVMSLHKFWKDQCLKCRFERNKG